MHTIFYAVNFRDYPYNKFSVDESSLDEIALAFAVNVNDGKVVDVVKWGKLQNNSSVLLTDDVYVSIYESNIILEGDGTLYMRKKDLNVSETALFSDLNKIGSFSISEQDKQYHRERIKGILENKYKKINPGAVIDPSFTVPLDDENDPLSIIIRTGREFSDRTYEIGGDENINNNLMTLPLEKNVLIWPVYQS